ncbi:MAG: (2Fe-2S)-binding protein [Acidobacteria bacterium]|nr:(2Fe-2S)-binding protein [Acidobacteriota bacterium]
MKNVTLEIDGRTVEAGEGTTLLKAAQSVGIRIPTLCNDDRLEPYGGCRMCMVEIETSWGRKRLVASCVYPVEEGLRVQTNTERVRRIRRMIIELLWPSSQVYAEEYGVTGSRFEPGLTDCSLCGLCLRYCTEIKKENRIYFEGRGIERRPALVEGSELTCRACGECFTLCGSGWIASRC